MSESKLNDQRNNLMKAVATIYDELIKEYPILKDVDLGTLFAVLSEQLLSLTLEMRAEDRQESPQQIADVFFGKIRACLQEIEQDKQEIQHKKESSK